MPRTLLRALPKSPNEDPYPPGTPGTCISQLSGLTSNHTGSPFSKPGLAGLFSSLTQTCCSFYLQDDLLPPSTLSTWLASSSSCVTSSRKSSRPPGQGRFHCLTEP